MHPERKTASAELGRLNLPANFKALDAGKFTGYASVFGVVDEGGDIVEAGAFKEFERAADGRVKLLFGHRLNEPPIGLAAVAQDAKGLRVDGELFLDDQVASRTYVSMKAGALDGMSIGFDTLPGGVDIRADGVRVLKRLRLWEVSVVNFPMNRFARVEAVKTAGECRTARELEELIHDRLGLSSRKSKAAANFLGALLKREDDHLNLSPGELDAIVGQLADLNRLLKPKG